MRTSTVGGGVAMAKKGGKEGRQRRAAKKSPSEVHAYIHINGELVVKKGWSKQQIFTQQECRKIKSIEEALGAKKPENVVKISEDLFYIIEAKNERIKVDTALDEARDYYAARINEAQKVKAYFVTGIAGNPEEGFIAKSQRFNDITGEWETVTENDIELTGLLSKNQISYILEQKTANIKDIEINDAEFLRAAEDINGILHEGGINKDYRARVISAILLALSEGTDINLNQNPSLLIKSINDRVGSVLKRHRKSDFSRFIEIELPSSEDNHNKFKDAVVKTIQILLMDLNIRSAMSSGKDILGKFYEVFLKYGNGAKEIGIVLTPRHITKFVASVLDVQPNDLVLDPTCGTGGFLVAAFDEVKKKATPKEFETFKKYGLYGIEQQDPVVSLALVNMIFRGDGKNNIIEGDCFAKWLSLKNQAGVISSEYLSEDSEGRVPPITKVMMNPPFPKKKTDNKEYLFVEQALKQMSKGVLFSVLPYSCLIKRGGYLKWRDRMLKENTLLSVITFPEDLFYPVGVHTVGIFIKKGIPHPKDKSQKVLWIRALNDGRLKKKGKRLENPRAQNDLLSIEPILRQFIEDQSFEIASIPAFQKASAIDWEDKDREIVPEAYLDDPIVTDDEIFDSIDQLIRDNIAYHIKFEKQLKVVDNA
jgi:type I restriction-modification system DNA methylase subunit